MRLSKKSLLGMFASVLMVVFLTPIFVYAESELDELKKVINDVTEKRSTLVKLREFEDKLIETYGHVVPPDTINKVVKEFAPGEALTIIVLMRLSEKVDSKITDLRKAGMDWDKIAGELNISLEMVIKKVKAFRRAAC